MAPIATEAELAAIESRLKQELPLYYAPSRITSVESLPTLPNGKVNLQALQVMATDLVAGGIQVEDSLGTMKTMFREQLEDQLVAYHGYSLWLFGIILSHIYGCASLFPYRFCSDLPATEVPGWVVLIIRGMSSDQCAFGILGLMAYNDARRVLGGDV